MIEPLLRYRPLVDDWEAFEGAVRRPLPVCVWTSTPRISPDALFAILEQDGTGPRRLAWRNDAFRLTEPRSFGDRWWYLGGLCHVLEEASLIPPAVLDVRPEHRVLDLCAAPGGKTAVLAGAMGYRGTIVANDVRIERLRSVRDTLDRLGITSVSVTRHDGCNYPAAAGGFDRILVDGPCSGEGTVRRKERFRARLGEQVSRDYARRQVALLRKAVQLCRPGGRIVYSTCTFAPEENEGVIDAVLRDRAAYGLRVSPVALPGLTVGPGVESWNGETFDPQVRHAARIWPHHNDTGGFFVAVLERTAGPPPDALESLDLDLAPREAWGPLVPDRFELSAEAMARYRVHRRGSRWLQFVTSDHVPPAAPDPEGVGARFVKTRSNHPRITSVAARVLASDARAHVVDLEDDQVGPFLARQTFALRDGQDAGCTATGLVIVRYRGFGLGTALFRVGRGELESMLPKRWASS